MQIKVSKTLLECAQLFKAKNDIRYYLNGICFKADGRVCSTNGHMAFIGGKHEGKVKDDLIISIQKAPTKRYEYAIIDTETLVVTYFNDAGAVKVGVGLCELIDGKFPDIDRVIPKSRQACDIIGFRAEYLARIAPAAKLFNPNWESVTLDLNGSDGSAITKLKSHFGETGLIVVMPMRL